MVFDSLRLRLRRASLGGLVLGEFAPVVVAAGAGIAGLGDRGDVDGGVELAVASSR